MSKAAALLRQFDLSASDIAQRAGVSEPRVNEILAGGKVTMPELRALARALKMPLSAFATGVRPVDSENEIKVLFRRVGNLSSQLEPTQEYVARYVAAALEVLPLRLELPEILVGLVAKDDTFETAEQIATDFRARLVPDQPFDPLSDLAELLDERAGIIIARLIHSKFEGASLVAGCRPFLFVSPRFAPRTLFTIAHELGHLLVHHGKGEPALFERASEIGGRGQRVREAFVDAFASSLLMPQQGVARVLQAIRNQWKLIDQPIGDLEILMLARFFFVSFDVAARRLEQLQLLPAGGARSLSETLKKVHGSAEQRADRAGLPARKPISIPAFSRTLLKAIDSSIEDGRVSMGWAIENFGLSIAEMYASRKSPR